MFVCPQGPAYMQLSVSLSKALDTLVMEFKQFITRFCNTSCLITVITKCHHYSWLLGCWGGEVSVMKEIYKQTWKREYFPGRIRKGLWVLVFRVVGDCLAPHGWIEIVPRGHSQNPSETIHYSVKCPLCASCGVAASSFHTSFIHPMQGFHKGVVWNSYQAACDTRVCGPSIWGTTSQPLGFCTTPFFQDKPTCLLMCLWNKPLDFSGDLLTSHTQSHVFIW